MLHPDDYVHLAPDGIGSQRYNHNDSGCSGSSKSLIVSRKEDDSISAYCFRCGEKGYYKPDGFRKASIMPAVSSSCGSLCLPTGGYDKFEQWPAEARRWLFTARLGKIEAELHDMVYVPWMKRVVIPCYDPDKPDTILGYNARGIGDFEGPKWVAKSVDNQRFFWHPKDIIYNNNIIYIVEDILSSIRINNYYNSISLNGTNLRSGTKNYLVKHYNTFIIFLDNDNSLVCSKALEIKKELSLYGQTSIITLATDPKNLSNKQLREVCDGAIHS